MNIDELLVRARKAVNAVYFAADEDVAKDLSEILKGLLLVISQREDQIADQSTTIANLSKVVANDLMSIEELRLQIRDAQEDAANYRTSAEAEIAQLAAHKAWADTMLQGVGNDMIERHALGQRILELESMLPVTDEAREDHPAAINPPAMPGGRVVKCSECGTTNTAPVKLTMGKVWRCSCGHVFEPKGTNNV